MIPSYLFYQLYIFPFLTKSIALQCDEVSEYTHISTTEVEDLSSRYMNECHVLAIMKNNKIHIFKQCI